MIGQFGLGVVVAEPVGGIVESGNSEGKNIQLVKLIKLSIKKGESGSTSIIPQ